LTPGPVSANPFYPIQKIYVQDSLQQNIENTISRNPGLDAQTKASMTDMMNQPSAYWIDVKEKINNQVKDILDSIVASNGKYTKVVFIIYDLPNRDCKALASNGQICCNRDSQCESYCNTPCQSSAKDCTAGLQQYKSEYIDPLYTLFSDPKYKNIDLLLMIEPDSVPNCVTNKNQGGCTDVTCNAYLEGTTYTLQKFSSLPNVYMYLDAGHGQWLGWENNLSGFITIVQQQGWNNYVRGFCVNVSNYQVLGKGCNFPVASSYNDFIQYLKNNPSLECAKDPCNSLSQYNAANNQANYVQIFSWMLAQKGIKFKTSDGAAHFVIDTGRNGNEDAMQGSEECATWCNVNTARKGLNPTTNTESDTIDALFWLKTPGESDGCIDFNIQQKCDNSNKVSCVRYDPNCGTHPLNIGYTSDQPCPPEAGAWFDYQTIMLNSSGDPPPPPPPTSTPVPPPTSTPVPPPTSTPSSKYSCDSSTGLCYFDSQGSFSDSGWCEQSCGGGKSDTCSQAFGQCKVHDGCKNWSDSLGCGIPCYSDGSKTQGGYFCQNNDQAKGTSTLGVTYAAYGCVDWSFQSKRMQEAEKDFFQKTGQDVYFGVGTFGSQQDKDALGQCLRITVQGVDKDLIVQAVNTGGDVFSNQFDLQMGDGGFGAFNSCAGDATTSMYSGTQDQWGKIYGGWDNKEDCSKLPQYPALWETSPSPSIDNLQDLCIAGFDKNVRLPQGGNPTILKICKVSAPPQLTAITGMVPSDNSTVYTCTTGNVVAENTSKLPCNNSSLEWCLTRMMDCRKPSASWLDNVNAQNFVPGGKIVQPCGRDGYHRIDNRCGSYPNAGSSACYS